MTTKRGGHRAGSGRKSLSEKMGYPPGTPVVTIRIKVPAPLFEKVVRLGGVDWVRGLIADAEDVFDIEQVEIGRIHIK